MKNISKIAKDILASKYIKGFEKFFTQGNEGATALEGILHKYDFSIDDLPSKLRKLALAVAKESFLKSDTQSKLNEIEKFLLQPKTFNAGKTAGQYSFKPAYHNDLTDPLYNTPVKLPKYNGKVTVTTAHGDGYKILKQLKPDLTKSECSQNATKFTRMADEMEKEWNKIADQAAQETWGRPFQFGDYKISGIASDEFSENFKDKLRYLAQSSSKAKSIASAYSDASKSRLFK